MIGDRSQADVGDNYEAERIAYEDAVDAVDLGFDREPIESGGRREVDPLRYLLDHRGTGRTSARRARRVSEGRGA